METNFSNPDSNVYSKERMREKIFEYANEGARWPYSANILDPIRCVRKHNLEHEHMDTKTHMHWYIDIIS